MQGRVFFDFHPQLFRLLLNWLRTQSLAGRGEGGGTPLSELQLEASTGGLCQAQAQAQEELMVLVDYLQVWWRWGGSCVRSGGV